MQQCGADEAKRVVLCSFYSLPEKAGGFIKPLNSAESFESCRQQQPPPRRRPEVKVESLGAILGFLRALVAIQIYSKECFQTITRTSRLHIEVKT